MATQPSYSPGLAPVTTADELAVLVQRAKTFTNASGAATAIREANTNEIICRARSGAGAPDVGTVLRTEGTFTGMCIRNGEELVCDDAQTDKRVDTSAIRALGVRSIAVVPIKEDARVLGVLAVFAPAACAFSSLHVATLNALADQISMLLRKERRSKTARHKEPPVSRPDVSAHANASQSFSKRPAASVASETEASRSIPVIERGAPEAETNQPARAEIVPPILVPEQIERHKEKRAQSTVSDSESRIRELQLACASRRGIDTQGGILEKRTNSIPKKFIVTAVIAAVLLAAFVTIAFVKIGSHWSKTPPPVVSQGNNSTSSQNASYPGPAVSTVTPDKKVVTGSQSQSKRNQRPEKNEQPGKPVPAPLATVTLSNSKNAIGSGSSAKESQDVIPDPGLSVNSTYDLTLLARPESTQAPGTQFHSDLVDAKVIRTVRPNYPEIARKSHMAGQVVLRVIVGKNGKVTTPKFISGPDIIRDAAFDAVKQWLFQPAMLNGEPIEQETQITIIFNL